MRGIFKRRRFRWLALPLAGLLLFGQLALAAQACMLRPESGAMQMVSDTLATDECLGVPADSTARLVNCLKAEQPANASVDLHYPVVLPPVPAVAELLAPRQLLASTIPSPAAHYPGAPPLQILFCSYQI